MDNQEENSGTRQVEQSLVMSNKWRVVVIVVTSTLILLYVLKSSSPPFQIFHGCLLNVSGYNSCVSSLSYLTLWIPAFSSKSITLAGKKTASPSHQSEILLPIRPDFAARCSAVGSLNRSAINTSQLSLSSPRESNCCSKRVYSILQVLSSNRFERLLFQSMP
jgi:hypothetical protein